MSEVSVFQFLVILCLVTGFIRTLVFIFHPASPHDDVGLTGPDIFLYFILAILGAIFWLPVRTSYGIGRFIKFLHGLHHA